MQVIYSTSNKNEDDFTLVDKRPKINNIINPQTVLQKREAECEKGKQQ